MSFIAYFSQSRRNNRTNVSSLMEDISPSSLFRQRQASGLRWRLSGCQCRWSKWGGRNPELRHTATQLTVSLPGPAAVGEDPAVWWRPVPAAVHGPGGIPDWEWDGDAQQRAQLCYCPDPLTGKIDAPKTTSLWIIPQFYQTKRRFSGRRQFNVYSAQMLMKQLQKHHHFLKRKPQMSALMLNCANLPVIWPVIV